MEMEIKLERTRDVLNSTGCLMHSDDMRVGPSFQDQYSLIARLAQTIRKNKTSRSAFSSDSVSILMDDLGRPYIPPTTMKSYSRARADPLCWAAFRAKDS